VNAPTSATAASTVLDSRFGDSAAAFRRFFLELREGFLERDSLFMQLELALLCREHVLIIGPPGTAKSAVASAVLGRILDETTNRPSLFSKQLAENTVQTDLIGPIDFKVLTETGRTEYLTEEGMLGTVHAFLDEVFDGRDMLLRSILNVLHERELKHGRKVTPGRCECAVMTSNRYLSEVVQRSPETLQAFADRISFICFTPKAFARKASRAQMLWRAQGGQRLTLTERLTLQQLDVLQDVVSSVEVPATVSEGLEALADTLERELLQQVVKLPDYVPTKYFSQRSMVKALWALKAVVVREKIYKRPDRKLVAEIADLEMLRHFFLLGGPPPIDLEALIKAAADPRERAQLEIIRVENKAFNDALEKVTPTLAQAAEREAVDLQSKDEASSAEAMSRNWNPQIASTVSKELHEKLVPGPRHAENRLPLIRAAEHLINGLEARVVKGTPVAQQTDPRAALVLLMSFSDVLSLARRVPEFSHRVPSIAGNVVEFCRQAMQMVALSAEATEFDDQLRLDGLSGQATALSDELSKLAEVLQVAAMVLAPEVEAIQPELEKAKVRVATALHRRAGRSFQMAPAGGSPKKTDPLEALAADSRRLQELEQALVNLSPTHRGLREALLTPMAQSYAQQVLSAVAFTKLDQFVRAVQTVIDNVAREGASADVVLRSMREIIEGRVAEFAKTLSAPPKTAPAKPQVLNGEAYTIYRQQLVASAPDGALLALQNLNTLLLQRTGAALAPALRSAVASAEMAWLGMRTRFLRDWLSGLLTSLPPVESMKSMAEVEKAFDALVKSRFPMLATREGELVRLQAAVSRMGAEGGDWGKATESAVTRMAEDFGDYSRRLLDARNGK